MEKLFTFKDIYKYKLKKFSYIMDFILHKIEDGLSL